MVRQLRVMRFLLDSLRVPADKEKIMTQEDTTNLRKRLYRALAGAPAAHPGTGGKGARGAASIGFGDPAPLVSGRFKLELTDEQTGEVITVIDDPNLVVSQAANLMASMAAGIVNSEIGYIELGDPLVALPPSLTDVTLQQTTGQRQVAAPVVASNTVTFTATWAAGVGNGFTYTEAGLFTNPLAAGTMFARKTGFSIVKTAAFSMTLTWLLTFSVLDACAEACYGTALVGSSYTVEDYIYDAVGGETQVVVPIDFVIGAKRLEVFLNGQRLYYTRHYIEAAIGANKGINLIAFTLVGPAADDMYFRHLRW